MASLQDDLDTLKVIASNLLRQFEKGSKTSNECMYRISSSRFLLLPTEILCIFNFFTQPVQSSRMYTRTREVYLWPLVRAFLSHPTQSCPWAGEFVQIATARLSYILIPFLCIWQSTVSCSHFSQVILLFRVLKKAIFSTVVSLSLGPHSSANSL